MDRPRLQLLKPINPRGTNPMAPSITTPLRPFALPSANNPQRRDSRLDKQLLLPFSRFLSLLAPTPHHFYFHYPIVQPKRLLHLQYDLRRNLPISYRRRLVSSFDGSQRR